MCSYLYRYQSWPSSFSRYLIAILQWLLVDSIAKQFNAFAKGFFSVCGGPALEMFKPQELELLICGSPTLDFHALEEVAILEDGYALLTKLLVQCLDSMQVL